MPDAQRTIELVFNGVDNTAAAVQSVLRNTRNFAGSIETATQPIADFTFAALRLEAQLIATGVAVTAFSVKLAGDFDTGFREIATLIDVPLEGLESFRQEILDYSLDSTSSLSDITAALYTAISAGQEYTDSIEFITAAEQLATAGRASLQDTTLVLASALNAYGASADEAAEYSGFLFQTVASGLTTLPELAGSLAQVTNVAATAGVSFDELLAALAAITSTGTTTDQAVTQLRGAILAIQTPTPGAVAAAERLGIAFNGEALAADGLKSILDEVFEATGGNTEAMSELFTNTRALQGALALTGGAAENFASTIELMADSTDVLNEAWQIMTGSFDSSIQIIQNALGAFFIAIGSPLLDEFNGVAQSINDIFTELAQSAAGDSGIGEVVSFIEQQFGSLEDTLETVAANIGQALDQADFSGFVDGVRVVSAAVGGLFGGIDLTTVNGLAAAITLAGTAFEGLSQFSAGVIESFEPLASLFFDVGSGVASLNAEALRSAGEFAGFTTQLNILSGAIVPLAAALLGLNQALALGGTSVAALGGLTAALVGAGGGGLVGALTALSGALAGGAVGFGLGTLANEISEITTGNSLSTWALDAAASIGLISDPASDLVASLNDVAPAANNAENSLFDFISSTDDLGESDIGIITELEALPGVANEAARAVEQVATAADSISLQEKLALIEGQSAITTARIQSDADITVAAFQSISSSIESTSGLLGDLYGELGEADNFRDRFRIEDEIEATSERLAAESEAQLALLRSQLRINQAREAALRAGQALIQVDGAGLQPHLEAIMFELLEAIQVRVNSDGYALLLGID